MDIRDRVFLVTGAGSGLGAATARRLAQGGGRLGLIDVNSAGGRAVADALGAAAIFIEADVCDEAAVSAAIAETRKRHGALHGAINCAGIAPAERVLGRTGPHSLAMFQRTVNVNLIGTFNVLRLADRKSTRLNSSHGYIS